ncbi:kinase-like protein [Metschnikowia bicuspidata var. bicuspidata NRRL YB-4993]|uniref:non-specific serine/threonine protein kinase n=1 Tax=Metschnikowia bicuspidata var. bicuspidata NRRL YB-4993 TaxID=869754 RepID=A0A1A0HFQ0_9ASCO|nr:kinase-like protein [Metschnikowia bicuspidata var. bicuspidata NRRL YB-4993]OBA22683.1 kinase-like protein [Metschnikowia bicuspidata var. bicuspidata NRRL YB-4993]
MAFFRSPRKNDVAVSDISQSLENVSFSLNMMDVDTSYRLPPRKAPYEKENVTPANSPTKLVLHTSPLQKLHRPAAPQQQNIKLHNNISHLQPPNALLPADFQQRANTAKTKRLTSVAQLYFLDYYCDMFDYVILRHERARMVEHKLIADPQYMADPQRQQLEWKNYVGRERAFLRKRRLKPKHRDFEMITQVGQGGYGQVFLARKKDTREVCALKILNKKLLVKLDETRHVLTERDILTNTRSEWLVKLLYAFQDPDKVYLAMEFVPGGDFRTLLNNTGYLVPPHARFYIAEMFAAVDSLHHLGFTHRDLKPENFLIDSKGHIKLTDFGLAAGTVSNDRIESMRVKLASLEDIGHYQAPSKLMYERQQLFRQLQGHHNLANSIVGSPDYMALEVLEGKNYNFTIDYWSLGCMLFEALCGYPPFSGLKQDETYYNLKNWKTALRRPQTRDGRYVFSDRTWQLIIRLIASPSSRLLNFKQVQAQPYFGEISDWDGLRDRAPPFTPQLDNEEDAGYFDDFEDEESMMKYKDVFARQEQNETLLEGPRANGRRAANLNNFIGFTFKHKSNPNNKFQNGEINLLGGGGQAARRLPFGGSSLDPLATLY